MEVKELEGLRESGNTRLYNPGFFIKIRRERLVTLGLIVNLRQSRFFFVM